MNTKTTIPLEKDIVNEILKYLKENRYFAFKTHGSPFQVAGLPDIIAIAHNTGRFVGLEVKRPLVGVVTELQKAMIRKINRVGGYACVVYSLDDARTAMHMALLGSRAPDIN